MLVYGQLEKAQIESFTAVTPSDTRPSASATPNRLIYCTDTKEFQISDGTSWKAQANLSGTQTLSGKTFSDALQIAEISTPATPSSGFRKLYAKNDNKLYQLNSSGIEAGLGAAFADVITQQFNNTVSSFTAGESITALNAVVNELHNGTGSNVYRIFKADSTILARRSFAGFSVNAATATAHIQTHTASAGLVASNVITTTLNSRVLPAITFASTSDATLQAVATGIAADPDVLSAVVTVVGGNQTGADDRVIVVTGRGARTITLASVVTLGASQATFASATTQAPVGDTVQLQEHGPLVGFSSLTVGAPYYLSTSGGITTTPTDTNPVYVGRAIDTTVLFVDAIGVSKIWGSPEIYVRSNGSSTQATSGAVADTEHSTFSAWSAGVASGLSGRVRGQVGGSAVFNGALHQLDGNDSASGTSKQFQKYDKVAWATLANRTTYYGHFGAFQFAGYFYAMKGSDGPTTNTTAKWSGSAWAVGPTMGSNANSNGAFSVNSLLNSPAGNTTNAHDSLNSSDVYASLTVFPVTNATSASGNSPSAKGICGVTSSTANYQWDGSAWSASIVAAASFSQDPWQPAGAYSTSRNFTFYNGGGAGGVTINTSQIFNGAAYSMGVSSTNSRTCGISGAF